VCIVEMCNLIYFQGLLFHDLILSFEIDGCALLVDMSSIWTQWLERIHGG
jgi:hypothetical protein